MYALGAGPGPVNTYRVDMPFPWGDDTEIKLPVQALVADAITAARLPELASTLVNQAIKEANLEAIASGISRRLEARMPDLVERATTEAEPIVDAWVNRALLKAAGAAGLGLLAYAVYRRYRK
jgi:hypothetical protein